MSSNLPKIATHNWRDAISVVAFVMLLVALPLAYAVAYRLLLHGTTGTLIGVGSSREVHIKVGPHYRVGGEVAKTFFGPMHALDRQLRPSVWRDNVYYVDDSP